MEVIRDILLMTGFLIAIIGELWILLEAFGESKLWRFGCLFPPIFLIFLITDWRDSSKPFFMIVGGWSLFYIGYLVGGGSVL